MSVLYLGSNEKKMQEENKDKTEARFAEGKQKMNSLKINVKMLKSILIIWSKYRWNIVK